MGNANTNTHGSQAPVPTTYIRPRNSFGVFPLEAVEQSLAERFEHQVQRYPEHIAVKSRLQSLTYAELNRLANQVAHIITRRCEKNDQPVALLFASGAPALVGMFGALKAGRSFVPLDPTQPVARLAYMLDDSQSACIVTAAPYLALLQQLPLADRQIIDIDHVEPQCSVENLNFKVSPDALACLLYTSGSTGQPKGVMHTHRNLLHEVMRRTNTLHISSEDRVTLFTTGTGQALGLTLSTTLNGAALYPLSIKQEGIGMLSSWLRQEAITLYHSAAPLFRQFVSTLTGKETFPNLRLIRLASDTVYPADLELYKAHFAPPCLFVNGLSSSETMTTCLYLMDKSTALVGNTVPVGYALDGIDIVILNEAGEDIGSSGVGEIAIKSRYLSPGYWCKPTLTQETFFPDPAGSDARIYRTGDLGRLHADGCLEHLGRKRFRVKVRGYSVETAEVEAALRSLESVKEAVVIPREARSGGADLLAYVVPSSVAPPSTAVLRQALMHILPDYMLPTAFIFLEALPLTQNSKVDRLALPALQPTHVEPRVPVAAPKTPIETRLVQLWRESLEVAQLGIHDDFFALGGHSLLAMQLLVRVRNEFHVDIPLATLVADATVAALARAIEAPGGITTPPVLLAYKPYGSKPPFFCIHGVELLARHMDPEQPFYALHPHALDGRVAPTRVEAMAKDYLHAIQLRQPKGPYFLGGYSFGGLVAFEIAHQLQRQGHKIGLLVLLDSGGPDEGSAEQGTIFTRLKEHLYQLFARMCLMYVRTGRTLPIALRMYYFLGTAFRARRAYIPQVYPGRLILLRARENPRDPLKRWGGMGQQGLDIYEIPGNHFTMLQEPRVQQVATMLKQVLLQAQRALN
jgi:amino acid adenylation domain-containing protein